MSKKTFEIVFSGSLSLTAEEVWPDRDGPAYPTARDVLKKMQSGNSKSELLREWNLENDLEITVLGESGQTETWEEP